MLSYSTLIQPFFTNRTRCQHGGLNRLYLDSVSDGLPSATLARKKGNHIGTLLGSKSATLVAKLHQ